MVAVTPSVVGPVCTFFAEKTLLVLPFKIYGDPECFAQMQHTQGKGVKSVHAHMLRRALDLSNFLLYMLIRVCDQFGWVGYARSFFGSAHQPHIFLWDGMIRSCVRHDLMGEAIEMYGNYVLLYNILCESRRWDAAEELREAMKKGGITKVAGSSWIEGDGRVHEFNVEDRSDTLYEATYLRFDELTKELKIAGYVTGTESVLFDIEEEEKEISVGHHSEKLAVAFGLINTVPATVIHIVKNLRICNDYHTYMMKLISKITSREIVVRDNSRFHIFRNGLCSCGDYW